MPPPFNGATYANQLLIESRFSDVFSVDKINFLFSKKTDVIEKFSVSKVFLLFKYIFILLWKLIVHKYEFVIYTPSASKISFLKDFAVMFIIKVVFRKTLICWMHCNNSSMKISENRLFNIMFYYIYKKVDKIVTVGSNHNPFWGSILDSNKISHIHYGIEDSIFKIMEKSNTLIRILFFSLMVKEKGWDTLLDAAKYVTKKHNNVEFCFAGPWTDKKDELYFHDKVKENGIDKFVKYLGPKYGNEKEELFLNSDIFVFPTRFYSETFGIVLLEAMKYGLPVIATEYVSIPEIVSDGVTGILIPTNDVNKLSDAIIKLIENKDLRITFGEAGKRRFKEYFTLDIFVNNWINLVNRLN